MATDGEEVEQPASAEGWNTLGNTRYQRGDIAGAEQAYRRAIELDPALFKPYGNLGTVLAGKRKLRDAIALFEKAIELNPKSHKFRTNLGNALRDLGRRDEAIEAYRASIAVQPSHAALHNLAVVLASGEEVDAALSTFERALEVNARAYETLLEMGVMLNRKGEHVRARAALERAIECVQPGEQADIGVSARVGESIDSLLLAIAAKAANPTPALAVVESRYKRQDLTGAAELAERLTRVFPAESKVWIAWAMLLVRDFGNAPAAAEVLLRGHEATNGADDLAVSVAFVVTAGRGEASGALAEIRRLFAKSDPSESSLRMALLLAHNCEEVAGHDLLDMHLEWAKRIPRKAPLVATIRRQGRIRIGYLSADFRRHSVACFIEPVLRAHDRKRFEIVCYSASPRTDRVTARLRALDVSWRDIARETDGDIAKQIASDAVDVLVDLGGHTSESRLTVLSHRPAPVQISYLGYPGTTGLPDVDFRIADPYVEPPGVADRWSSERILRLPESAWCFEPPFDAPPVDRIAEAPPTFGSFNALTKLGDRTLSAWAEILRNTPEARLMIKTTHASHPAVRARVSRALKGIDPARIELLERVPGDGPHLEKYREVDVGLDTFPYNGTTTTCEALWMGVPVVTRAGERHASRVGVSLLTNAGLNDLITTGWDDYVSAAVRLIGDKARLKRERVELRDRIRRSALGDAERYTRSLEDLYIDALEARSSSAG